MSYLYLWILWQCPASLASQPCPLMPSHLLFVLLFAAHSKIMSKIRCVLLNNEHVMLKRQAALLFNSDATSLPYHAAPEPHPLTPNYLLLVLLYPAICCAFIEKEHDKMCVIKWARHAEAASSTTIEFWCVQPPLPCRARATPSDAQLFALPSLISCYLLRV